MADKEPDYCLDSVPLIGAQGFEEYVRKHLLRPLAKFKSHLRLVPKTDGGHEEPPKAA